MDVVVWVKRAVLSKAVKRFKSKTMISAWSPHTTQNNLVNLSNTITHTHSQPLLLLFYRCSSSCVDILWTGVKGSCKIFNDQVVFQNELLCAPFAPCAPLCAPWISDRCKKVCAAKPYSVAHHEHVKNLGKSICRMDWRIKCHFVVSRCKKYNMKRLDCLCEYRTCLANG
jgi:hypothetical protein